MSKIALSGNASGTGTLTIAAPNTDTDRTLTLPDSTGTILNDQSNIEAQVKTATNATGSAPIYSCRAWVNFNGTGTVAIREDGNVSSVTDNGTGDYTVNFTTAMPDANYSATTGLTTYDSDATDYRFPTFVTAITTTSVTLKCNQITNGVSAADPDLVMLAIFR